MADLTATILYSHEGATNTALAPATTAAQVQINDADGNASNADTEISALRTKVNSLLEGGVAFKGALTSTAGLPTVGYKAGWQYVVQEAGTYAGQTCEEGDLVVCVKDYASGSASNADWAVIQANIVGAVTGPSSAVAGRVATFDGTSGKIIKDSGYTIAKSVPANAVFTDTTYNAATAVSDGLMTAGQYAKLYGIESGADVTDAANVAAAGALMKSSATLDDIADGSTYKRMTSAEKTKLSGIAAGAEVNQNAFAKVTVGTTTITASAKQDTLTIEAGDGVTISASGKKVTIKETYIDSCVVSDLDSVPSNLRNGGLVILKS